MVLDPRSHCKYCDQNINAFACSVASAFRDMAAGAAFGSASPHMPAARNRFTFVKSGCFHCTGGLIAGDFIAHHAKGKDSEVVIDETNLMP